MIPHDDLAFQWDVCQDVLAWKDYFPNRPESYKEDITGMLARLGNAVPEPVEFGYHLCCGTPNDEHVVMPTDLANTVEIAHGILAGLERSLQYVHVPAPKHRDDNAYYAPLAALRLPAGCDLYLGVIHHDDRDGDQRRITAASKTVSDFGIATECGWPRRPGPRPLACSTATVSRWRANDPRAWSRDSSRLVSGIPGAVHSPVCSGMRKPYAPGGLAASGTTTPRASRRSTSAAPHCQPL